MVQAIETALSPLEYDIEQVRAWTDLLSSEARLIPLHEGAWTRITAPYAHTELDERGYILFWDVEDAWLDE